MYQRRKYSQPYLSYQFTDSVKHKIDNSPADGILPSSIVIGSVFFTSDELLWVEELSVGSCTNLIYNPLLQSDRALRSASWVQVQVQVQVQKSGIGKH